MMGFRVSLSLSRIRKKEGKGQQEEEEQEEEPARSLCSLLERDMQPNELDAGEAVQVEVAGDRGADLQQVQMGKARLRLRLRLKNLTCVYLSHIIITAAEYRDSVHYLYLTSVKVTAVAAKAEIPQTIGRCWMSPMSSLHVFSFDALIVQAGLIIEARRKLATCIAITNFLFPHLFSNLSFCFSFIFRTRSKLEYGN